jgi:carboxyl-terminal processing protease
MSPIGKKLYLIVASIAIVSLSAFRTDYFEISKQLDIFATLFKELNIYYVDNTNPDELMEEAITSMLRTLDPYTTFMTEDEAEDFQIHTVGEYAGIGASIRIINNKVVVAQVYEGFAADKAGIKAGDILLEIDDEKINNENSKEISNTLKGSVKSQVKIKYKRRGVKNAITVKFPREKIIVKSVPFYGMVNNNVGYIILNSFSRKAYYEVSDAFEKLKEQGMEYLIFDLRGNPGGLLSQAVEISGLFLPNKSFVVETKGKIDDWNHKYYTRHKPKDTQIPIVILTDFNSASASEIVAGSLQDLDRCIIMGSRTFGKGLVQQPRSLSYGTKLKITIAKYYIPSGRCIQAKDYFHRDNNGKAKEIPDSLRNEFSTIGGRIVFDGAGIEPDVHFDEGEYSDLVISLINQNIFFDYSVDYCNKTEGKINIENFEISDNDLNNFEKFAHKQGLKYESELSEKLSEFKQIATEKNMIAELNESINSLNSKLKENFNNSFEKDKEDIKHILELNIINNDYHERGRHLFNMKNDKLISQASALLQNKTEYEKLLTAKR